MSCCPGRQILRTDAHTCAHRIRVWILFWHSMTRQRLDRFSQQKLGIEGKVSAMGTVTGGRLCAESSEGNRSEGPLL